jgi:hypothetical protein
LFLGLIALACSRAGARPAPVRPAVAGHPGRFVGFLDIQILLGVALVIGGRRPGAVWGIWPSC